MPVTHSWISSTRQLKGRGGVFANTVSATLRADSLIDANVDGLVLNVNPNADGLTNEAIMQASGGGILQIDGTGGGSFDNSTGVIQALAGSELRIGSNAIIDGGTIQSVGDGLVTVGTSLNVFLSNLNLDANIFVNNNSDFGLEGNINNSGSITISSAGNVTSLEVQPEGATLTGGGTITLADNAAARIDGAGNPFLDIVDQTIQGRGTVLANTASAALRSDSSIVANMPELSLIVDPNADGFVNEGTMQATSGGILNLGTGDFDNTNGLVQALAGSEVQLANGANVTGGTIQSVDDGLVTVGTSLNVFLNELTLDADVFVGNNSDFGLSGEITNNKSITISSAGNVTSLEVQTGGATIVGPGEVVLAGTSFARIDGLDPITIEARKAKRHRRSLC